MKKSFRIIFITFLLMIFSAFMTMFITSCEENVDISHDINNEQEKQEDQESEKTQDDKDSEDQESEKPQDDNETENLEEEAETEIVKSDPFFWGTWVRMDSGTEYNVLETRVDLKNKSYRITSSDSSTLSIGSLGTFIKESDSVIVCDSIPYFRKGGTNIKYTIRVVGFVSNERATSIKDNGIGVTGYSDDFPSFESEGKLLDEAQKVGEDDGLLYELEAATLNSKQKLKVSHGDEPPLVVQGMEINNSGDYMGTVALVGKDDYNLKITGTISEDQKDNGYLYGNNAKSYDMDITITNISSNKCTSSACKIETDDPNLSITSKDGTVLSAFTISTLLANTTRPPVKVSLSYGSITEPFVDTGITITIKNPTTGQQWKDYIPLRFFKGLVPITVSCQSPEKNDQAALNGFIIYPDGNNQFFSVKNNASKVLYVPSFGEDKQYKMVFSGATVTSTLSDSTEMYYTVAPGTTKIREVDTNSGDINKLIEYLTFGGNNHREDNAYNTTESFQAYLSEGEIDYYTLKADSEEFYAPGAKSFAVVSYASDYEEVPSSFYIKEGSMLTEDNLPELEHAGVSFLGWYEGRDDGEAIIVGEKKVTAGNYVVKGDVTLIAKWDYVKYGLTYELDGGTNAVENPSYYTIENESFAPAAPSKKGYDFEGWFTEEDFSGEEVTSINTAEMKDFTLYAKWKPVQYKITYILNGGSAKNPTSYTIEDTVTLEKAKRRGYAFSGWYYDESFSGDKVTVISLGTTEDITLYARWLKECTVTYKTNHGTVPAAIIIGETDTIPAENLPELECNGYIFEGWYVGDVPVTPESYTVTGNLTLTAKWKLERYTIDYNLNGGNNSTLNPSGYTIETEKYTLETPVKTGYDFEGWFTDAKFEGDKFTRIGGGTTENLILYAKWKPTVYAITYELDGGSNASSNPSTYTIETDTIPLADPEKANYVFRGWFTQEDFSGTNQTEIATGSYGVKTYYAKWLKKCTVSFVTEHGTTPEAIVLGEGESVEASQIVRLSEKGWLFRGWYTDSSFADEKKSFGDFVVTNDIEMYARWEEYTGPDDGFVFVEGGTVVGSDGYTRDSFHTPELSFPTGKTVTLSSFFICDHELTQGEYTAIMGSNPSYFKSDSAIGGVAENKPVENFSLSDAIYFCNKKSLAEGLTPCYSVNGDTSTSSWNYTPHSGKEINGTITWHKNANGYRLPTNEEWEYAARGGQETYGTPAFAYYFAGADSLDPVGWYEYNSSRETHEVKKKLPNALGLYDMSGNVWEWCWSTDSSKVIRGGSWHNIDIYCSVPCRKSFDPTIRPLNSGGYEGIRLVRSYIELKTVTLFSDHGDCPAAVYVSDNLSSSNLPNLEEDGWVFGGWYSDSTFSEGSKITNDCTVEKGLVLYAKWIEINDSFVFVEGRTVVGSDDYNQHSTGSFPSGKTVTVDPFFICEHTVTQSEYETYCCYTQSAPDSTWGVGADYPVYNVSWYDAIVYCNLKSIAEQKTPCYVLEGETDPKKWPGITSRNGKYSCGYTTANVTSSSWDTITCNLNANGYRLPSDEEWEYAARGGHKTYGTSAFANYFAGATTTNYLEGINSDLDPVGWYSNNSNGGKCHEVKKKAPNELGLYDMSGNISEMTNGALVGSYRTYSTRGGTASSFAWACSVSRREEFNNPYTRSCGCGFRLVCSVQ